MKNRIFLIPLVVILFSVTGCFGVNGNFKQMRNYLLNNIDGSFKKDTEFAVGPAAIALAGFAASFSDEKDGEFASDVLGNISKVQIGVYKVKKMNKFSLNFPLLKNISEKMERKGWKYIVRTIEDGEMTAIFLPKDLERGVKKLFIFSVNDRQRDCFG
ncbi:MAG: hypothetical protein GXO87_14435 [Chlorobi bacterium]|nr:hypothetical protein [Chlorobiota bacterium]